MESLTEIKYIVRDEQIYGGKPRIQGHRVAVHDIAAWHWQGETPEGIARGYGLALAQVYAALVYYYDHQEEIDRQIEEEDAEIRARAAADTSPRAQRLRAGIAAHRDQLPRA